MERWSTTKSTSSVDGRGIEEVPPEGDEDLPVDANFYFFLIICEYLDALPSAS